MLPSAFSVLESARFALGVARHLSCERGAGGQKASRRRHAGHEASAWLAWHSTAPYLARAAAARRHRRIPR
eukprot:3351212-Prymnesium_polylepis.1